MKKAIAVFMFVSLLLSSCHINQVESMDEIVSKYSSYTDAIQALDSTLVIGKDVHPCANGDCIVMYSVHTEQGGLYSITFTCVSSTKAKLTILFYDAEEYLDEYHLNLLSSFITLFNQSGIGEEQAKKGCESIKEKNYVRFNSHSSLSWDEDTSFIDYYEKYLK